ncbi:5903_t:CDS:2 [Ambispora leptoticha]|uniref:5903_t:CDS:1 n=1 Tax=Ambispora leptoticha TaxID=144679 RepID=A0A9N9D763_9GLOM|nr:5903_t:CDS:2 [Ambispora leptoticha]
MNTSNNEHTQRTRAYIFDLDSILRPTEEEQHASHDNRGQPGII